MARYLVLRRAFLQLADCTDPRVVRVGEIVNFAGEPTPGLFPLDDKARAASSAAKPKVDWRRREWDLARKRGLAGLTRSARAIADRAAGTV